MFSSRLIRAIGDAVRQDSTGHVQNLLAQDLLVGNLAVNVRYRVTSCSILLNCFERYHHMPCCAGIAIGKELANTPD